jgi:beta-galactosidase/beta-glucuronidase
MDINPLDAIESPDPHSPSRARRSLLNPVVAVTVALLATFTGVCKVKDDNIVQAMQQAQADKLDHWAARATLVQLQLQAADRPADRRAEHDKAIDQYQKLAVEQAAKKDELRQQALADQEKYDALNFRDDQFDLSDTGIAIAISLLAVASLTDMWWLYLLSLVPAGFGVVMGLAGLGGWNLHPSVLASLLS